MSGLILILRLWTLRISIRPLTSGKCTCTERSNRPGRVSAGFEHIRAVGRSQDDHLVGAIKAVHLDEDGVECLFALSRGPRS